MLKRTRSVGEIEQRNSLMNDSDGNSGDRQRICSLNIDQCRILNELRRNELLCDAKISTKDRTSEFSVHRFILAGKIIE